MKSTIRQLGYAAFVIGVTALGISTDANAQRKFTFGYDQPRSTAVENRVSRCRANPILRPP